MVDSAICEKRLATVPEVAKSLSLSRTTIYGLMDSGQLAYVKLGKSRRVPVEEVGRLIRENTVAR